MVSRLALLLLVCGLTPVEILAQGPRQTSTTVALCSVSAPRR